MAIDIDLVRMETPGCAHVLHFNNAGASLMPEPVLSSIKGYLELEARIGAYEVEERARNMVERLYLSTSHLLGCHPSEIAFLENATRAWDMAFYSIPFLPKDRILCSESEYSSNYIAFLHMAKKVGVSVEVIPNDEYGQISLKSLETAIDDRVKLIALTHIPTNSSLINPACEVGKIAQKAGILYLLDATQSIGQIPLDVSSISCDILCAAGKKYLRGPRGTGLLYIRNEILPSLSPPFLELNSVKWISQNEFEIHPNARRFESWESSLANKMGLGSAIDYALKLGIKNIFQRITFLATLLRKNLSAIPDVTLHEQGKNKCGIVTFTIKDMHSNTVRQLLLKKHINVSISTEETARLNMPSRKLKDLVRASIHYYNNEKEIERFCNIISGLRKKRFQKLPSYSIASLT